MSENFSIREDDLTNDRVVELVLDHKKAMLAISPKESVHALDLEELRSSDISFWTIWDGDALMGCGDLKALNELEGEIKSMRTHVSYLRQGIAGKMLDHIIRNAKARGYKRLYLETGSRDEFIPAHKLYEKYGFSNCGPFADYVEDDHSRFMYLEL